MHKAKQKSAYLEDICIRSHAPEASISLSVPWFLITSSGTAQREEIFELLLRKVSPQKWLIYQGLSLKESKNTSTPVEATITFTPFLLKLFTNYLLAYYPNSSSPFCTFLLPKTVQKLPCFIFLASFSTRK